MINTTLNDRYLILEKIGTGGTATVYKAKDTLLDRIVAVKILQTAHMEDEETIRKFRREARAAGSLSHFNLVGVFDVGLHNEIHYIVMELAEGKTLKDYILEKGSLAEEEAIDITLQVSAALKHAHENGVIHQDIKPQNIILNKDGNAKVADFGIARAVSNDSITNSDDIYGSVRYFSPEQAAGEEVDHRTDMYSLAIVLYEMLSGRLPFTGTTPFEWALNHINEEPINIKNFLPEIDESLANIIMQSLSKDPDNRFNDIEDFAYHLKKYKLGMPVKIKKPVKIMKKRSAQKGKILTKRNKIILAMLIIAFLGVIISILANWFDDYTTVPIIEVPQLVGEHVDDAKKELKALGFEIEYAIKQNHPTIEENHVIRHRPEAGVEVKKGRIITLTLSEGIGYENVPNVIGFTLEEAKEALASLGFELGKVSEEFHPTIVEGDISDINPKPSTEVKIGTKIDIIVSLGQDEDTVKVPNLVDMTRFSAQQAILDAELELGEITEKRSNKPADTVLEQSIRAGINVLIGTKIDFVISDGRQP